VFSSFFANGHTLDKFKFTYCFCDGLLNIMQTGQKEKQDQTTSFISFRDEAQLESLARTLADYLVAHLNYGTFSGIVGGNIELIMKLDLAI
jgi:hypothetical protein